MTDLSARDPRAEARAVVGPGFVPLLLEPSPPAVRGGEWADDPLVDVPPAGAGPAVSPVGGRGDQTWSQWAAAHPDAKPWCRDRWLGPHRRLTAPPAGYDATRAALHRVAVYVMSPARQAATSGKLALRWTLGGFGTPFFGDDEQVRVVGDRLVRQAGDDAADAQLSTLTAAAQLALDGPPEGAWAHGFDVPPLGDVDASLRVDRRASAWLGDWFGFAWSVLEELRADHASTDASRVQLWPEHFDAAFECGTGVGRAGYGLSPGDSGGAEPYVYVTLWHGDEVAAAGLRVRASASEPVGGDAGVRASASEPVGGDAGVRASASEPVGGEMFAATAFAGAVLPLSSFVDADDQRATVLAFLRERRDALAELASADPRSRG